MRTTTRLIAAYLVFGFAALCQTSRGTVSGVVLDSTGAVVPKASVNLTSLATGVKLTTGTNESGVYRFDAVDLGVYDLTVTQPGFRTWLASRIPVEANRVSTVDPRLEVGTAETSIEVSSDFSQVLIRDSPLRGGNFESREVRDLPLVSANPLSLARTLPGVTDSAGSRVWTGLQNPGGGFSINGQRPRGNNYLLDGTENNDVWLTGAEQGFSIADAVEEVSVQTANFGVEFGRAGGGVFNIVTKSGTNALHGTLLWGYQSQRFDSIDNLNRLTGVPQSVFSNNILGFTAGGPIRRNKTFFFAAFEQNDLHSTANVPLQVPTADAVTRLRQLFPSNSRLDLYLGALGNLRGVGAPFTVILGIDPQTGIDRGSIQFATASYVLPAVNDGPQWLGRIDHFQSEKHRLSWRYTYDSRLVLPSQTTPNTVPFPGFIQADVSSHQNFLFSDSYTFGPSYTNEFRFSYGRPDGRYAYAAPGDVPLAQTLPKISIVNVAAPGLSSGNTQFHYGNNFLWQDTQTKVKGRHALRYGVELLRQLITQTRGANDIGSVAFTNAAGYSAFANFLDDFSGPSANSNRVLGVPVLHPDQFRQSYFFQDNWTVTPTLSLTMGIRYENFGQAANVLTYPAFAGFDPAQFLIARPVKPDNNNWGPAAGLAWSPTGHGGWIGRLLGEGKTVLRAGYQVSYDAFFTQMIFLGPATTSPNALAANAVAQNAGRGAAGWFEQLPTVATPPAPLDAQIAIDPNLRSPYTERWSAGIQRQLSQKLFLDVSYVGSESHKLTTKSDFNPRLLSGVRLYPAIGTRDVRTSEGNSSYQSFQARLDRRFAAGLQVAAAYTWSKYLDSTSEGVGNQGMQDADRQNRTSVPISQGGLKLDRGLSDYDRPQRLTLTYVWSIPGPRAGWSGYLIGGWSLGGIATFQSGTPFSVANGTDRNNDGIPADRPDIGNPAAPLNTRANLAGACSTGYQNPDTGACVSAGTVHWIEGAGLPNPSTVGRNTLRTAGTNNFDMNLSKSIPFGETRRIEFRWEALNAFNHPQFVQAPLASVNGTPAGRFLNRDYTDSGIRSMRGQIKVVF